MCPATSQPEESLASAIGRLMAFWGFRRNLGRIWASLYLSPRPVSAGELCERLKLSAGSVSMALRELQDWSAVHKQYLPGERREYFVAEGDIWRTISRVMENRESREVQRVVDALEDAEGAVLTALDAAATSGDDAAVDEALFRQGRIAELRSLADSGQDLLRLLIGQEGVGDLVEEQEPATDGRRPVGSPRIPRAPDSSESEG